MKTFGIVGAIVFAISVALGYFLDFKGDVLVQIALDAFALTLVIIGAVKEAKNKGKFSWKIIACIVLAVIGGVLCAIGGASESIFGAIAGAVIALIGIILGIVNIKKK